MVIESLGLPGECAVYELSSRGALFRWLRRRFPNFYFSEFFDDVPAGGMKGPVPCQDVQDLALGDETFSLVTCTEVFEHVPDDRRGFREIYRVLKKDGYFVFTVPLMSNGRTLERAAKRQDGSILHLREPEYHSDRLRGRRTVLAYRTYGADIRERLDAAGFSSEIKSVDSPPNAVRGQHVIVARKQRVQAAG